MELSSVEELEKAVRQLSPDELAAFRLWFAEYDAEVWDQQLQADAATGRLDSLSAQE